MNPVPFAALALLAACSTMAPAPHTSVSSRSFGTLSNGTTATLWTLQVPGLAVDVSDFGATLVAVRMPDRAGVVGDVVLGFDDVTGYASAANQYFGCTTGRVCNRIAKGRFTLDGVDYQLAINNEPNHLHGGGERSFDKVAWRAEVGNAHGAPSVRFTYRSRDGEEGYPGNLDVAVTYALLPLTPPQLRVTYEAQSDRRTPINLTNHAYWNLAGAGAPTVLDHQLQVAADHYTPLDDTGIPTGAIAPVAGTALDFTRATELGLWFDRVKDTPTKGYDHNFVLRGGVTTLRPVAHLWHPGTQRSLRVLTTEPGLQVYSGNYLRGQSGKGGAAYPPNSAVCLETQHFPDSVHHTNFPTTILEPGQRFTSTTVHVLGVEDSVASRSL